MKKVLIIEDDDFLRSLAVTKLQKSGFAVTTAADGEAGLSLALTDTPDLLLLDLMLPGMDGFAVLEKLRENPATKTLKVVIFSNLGDSEDIKRGQSLGVVDYLVKASFTLDELVEKITALIQ